NDHRVRPAWNGDLTFHEGYLLGLLVAGGTLEGGKAVLSVCKRRSAVNAMAGAGADGVVAEALRAAATLRHRDVQAWSEIAQRDEFRLGSGALRELADRVGIKAGSASITSVMEQGSSDFCRGFLRGIFDAAGFVQRFPQSGFSVRLVQPDRARLQAVQRMLLRLGIASELRVQRPPSGPRRLRDVLEVRGPDPAQPRHELIVAGVGLVQFQDLVGFADCGQHARLQTASASGRQTLERQRYVARVESIEADGVEDVFDVQVPGINAFDANGILAHNCGEQPLPPHGACLLGSINLARLVDHAFAPNAGIDTTRLEALTATAVRFLDDAIDVSNYPLPAQKQEAKAKRRIGLGVTGLADALILCGARYGTPGAVALAETWMATIKRAAYLASAEIAREKGSFPLYDAERFSAAPNPQQLPEEVRSVIGRHGMRNGLVTSIAPTGTISLLAGNVSSGIEPVFDFQYERRVLERSGEARTETVEDYAHALFRQRFGSAALTPAFVTAEELAPSAHLQMQAALQRHVDSSISKTINCPADISFETFKNVYLEAYALGLKGCTTYRPNTVTGAVLSRSAGNAEAEQGPAPMAATATQAVLEATIADAALLPGLVLPERHGEVVYMAKPLEREPVLSGYTYKLRWPGSDHATYITINDIECDPPAGGGPGRRRRPFEIFINSKNLEHYAWTVALTRMISAIFRRGGDVSFVVEELKAVFDPQGGQWMGGRYVPSLLAAIGGIIETHMIRTGFLAPSHEQEPEPATAAKALAVGERPLGTSFEENRRRLCPRCGAQRLRRQEGCLVCDNCGYSKCN
ncbi:MAG TPA: LAGLIDADG family homing endonuclease, partial [Hyphomicrobiaceae bacterium]|nr:LAGLIDADG family homing endonuclease [Hyphomicrobiaceae bacterium]